MADFNQTGGSFDAHPSGVASETQAYPPHLNSSSSTSLISSLTSRPMLTTLVALFLGYVTLCNLFRFRAMRALHRRMGFTTRASLGRMTNDEAQQILQFIITQEFPMFYELALQFALYKTYAFESMSKVIVATKELADPVNTFKRYEDTTVLFGEFSLSPPSANRTLKAIARINYLHAPYRATGQITNPDLLYTLSVCVTEPIRFMALYEWRALTDTERAAVGTFWQGIGEAMGIRYDGYLARAGRWADGLEFVEDITAWAKGYEIEHMKPARVNLKPSGELVRLMTWHVPGPLKGFARECLTVLMGDRIRDAFYFPEPGIFAHLVTYAALSIRRLTLRYLMPPRLQPKVFFSPEEDPKTGRIQHFHYLVHPFYYPVTLWSRYGPTGWITRMLGGFPPGSKEGMHPDGFLFEEVGPKGKFGQGAEEMEEDVQRMRKLKRGRCPFSGMAGA